jgi:hypothetical protein
MARLPIEQALAYLDALEADRKAALALTRLGQPDGISPSRMAEMLEVDKATPKVRC